MKKHHVKRFILIWFSVSKVKLRNAKMSLSDVKHQIKIRLNLQELSSGKTTHDYTYSLYTIIYFKLWSSRFIIWSTFWIISLQWIFSDMWYKDVNHVIRIIVKEINPECGGPNATVIVGSTVIVGPSAIVGPSFYRPSGRNEGIYWDFKIIKIQMKETRILS